MTHEASSLIKKPPTAHEHNDNDTNTANEIGCLTSVFSCLGNCCYSLFCDKSYYESLSKTDKAIFDVATKGLP